MTRVKICSITTAADRDAAIAAGADALGFIVDVPIDSQRVLSADRAARLIAGVPPFVTTVLVTMPSDADGARTLRATTGADAIQIHNDLDPTAVETLERVIKRVPADVEAARRYGAVADALVVDAVDDAGAGGTGHTVDWERARAVRDAVDVPVVLAGGLRPANVAAAIDAVDPFAVDVSSGVEATEGEKDHPAVEAFTAAANGRPPHLSP